MYKIFKIWVQSIPILVQCIPIWVQCIYDLSTMNSNLSTLYSWSEYNVFKIWIQRIQFEYRVFNLSTVYSIRVQCIQSWVQCIPIWVHCIHNLSTMYSKLSTRYSMCSELRSECPNKKEGGQLSLAEGNNTMLILNFNSVKTHLICS